MKYVTRQIAALLAGVVCACSAPAPPHEAAEPRRGTSDGSLSLREVTLRKAALDNGFLPAAALHAPIEPARSAVGGQLFESTLLSLNGDMSCQKCHLDRFSSADGLPNAVGVGGQGEGNERLARGGRIVPRNVLALWGRGGVGLETFFWDGKVERTEEGIVSQFGEAAPSEDPLVVAAHLPFVEIREMIDDDAMVQAKFEHEDVDAADELYAVLANRLRKDEALGSALATAYGVSQSEIEFGHAADAIATFIRDRFRIRETKFHRFVFGIEKLNREEIAGGLIFYGKGQCSACHSGPYFTDFSFHTVAFPQAGFGKNGFGVDYGRYNVTFEPDDLYKFRTPPLYNVSKTAPYSHSGSVMRLDHAIHYHFDPLRHPSPVSLTQAARIEHFKRLAAAGNDLMVPQLSDQDVEDLVAFLGALSF